jgi:putative nucleotidyltransferase with HDIG domain
MSATLLARPPQAGRSALATLGKVVVTDLDRVDTYPTLSETTVRVLEMVNKADVSVAEVARIVRNDGVIAAAVLRAANSCAIRGARVIEEVQQAVLRMGLQECCKLLSTMGVKNVYNRCGAVVQERCDAILRHALFVARLASGISKESGVASSGVAFTAGLLHDIGRVVAAVKCPDLPGLGALLTGDEAEDVLAVERAHLGTDHCTIGADFATRNKLPASLTAVIQNHHRPADEGAHRELVALVAVAERIANHVHRNHNITGYNLVTCPHFPVLSRGWPASRASAFQKALSAAVVTAMRETRTMLKACE